MVKRSFEFLLLVVQLFWTWNRPRNLRLQFRSDDIPIFLAAVGVLDLSNHVLIHLAGNVVQIALLQPVEHHFSRLLLGSQQVPFVFCGNPLLGRVHLHWLAPVVRICLHADTLHILIV